MGTPPAEGWEDAMISGNGATGIMAMRGTLADGESDGTRATDTG